MLSRAENEPQPSRDIGRRLYASLMNNLVPDVFRCIFIRAGADHPDPRSGGGELKLKGPQVVVSELFICISTGCLVSLSLILPGVTT